MNQKSINKIHFVGIGGIGNSAVAKMMLAKKKIVTGSDLSFSDSETINGLRKIGAKIFYGHQPSNVADDTDLLIYSPAVPENNPERQQAKKQKIPQFSYPEFLGELSREKFTVAVSGTNGKSTTTAMLGLILEAAKLDPTIIVGSKVPSWQGNLRLSNSVPQNKFRHSYIRNKFLIRSPLVVEACEWRAHMLNLWPKIIVLTNLEEDHLDYYRDIRHLIKTFQKYIEKLPKDGLLILNADDPNLAKLRPKCRVITYGIKNKADIMAKNVIVKDGRQKFDLISTLQHLESSIQLPVPGLFNVYNALAAIAVALQLGVKPQIIARVLENFHGIWRRFEIINKGKIQNSKFKIKNCRNVLIISDYAHHPTAVAATIKAAREFFPSRRLVVVFQPHHHNRTKKLFNNFVKSFDEADLVIISEIYDVAGREESEDQNVSSKDLVGATKRRINALTGQPAIKEVIYTRDLSETKKQLLKIIQPNDVILIMGAGDIYKIVDQLIQK